MPIREEVVELVTYIRATPGTVFRFFSDPERFARWWSAPGGGRATIEPRVGGAVRIEYGNGAVMSGRVVEIVPERRFVLTWGYERGNDAVPEGQSRVEFTLDAAPGGTRLTLRHSGLPGAEQQRGHELGWRHYASCMASECAAEELGPRVAPAAEAWRKAWAETDPAARRAALAECCETDMEFLDAYSALVGIDELCDHIGNAQRHTPGLDLLYQGPPQFVQGFARIAWRLARQSDGRQAFAGANYFELSAAGKIRRLVGFWDGA